MTLDQANNTKKRQPTQVDLRRPVSVVSSLVTAATGAEAFNALGKSNVRPAVKAVAATGAGLLAGTVTALGVRKVSERFTPQGDQSNFVEDRYKRAWETRRKLYGPSGGQW